MRKTNRLKLLTWFLIIFIASCSKLTVPLPQGQSIGGNEVGNGGDNLRILFEAGREYAAHVVDEITPEAFRMNSELNPTQTEIEWLVSHRIDLKNDIRGSRHILVDALPSECPPDEIACAPRNGVVYLDRNKCARQIARRQQAGELLIHESLHHLIGAQERKVTRYGLLVSEIFVNYGHPQAPHWEAVATDSTLGPDYERAVWTGKELAIFTDFGEVRYYDPISRKMRMDLDYESSPRKLLGYLGDRPSSSDHAVWAGGEIYFFVSDDRHSQPLRGVRYTPENRLWRPVGIDPGLRFGYYPTIIAAGNKIIVWGGLASRDSVRAVDGGAIYDTQLEEWSEIPPGAGARIQQASVYAGNQLLVWGGAAVADGQPLGDGAAYDFSSKRWSRLPSAGSPNPRTDAIGVWTGKEMIVYGGFVSEENRHKAIYSLTGAIYRPGAPAWIPMKEGLAAPNIEGMYVGRGPYETLEGLWDGIEMLVHNSGEFVAYNPSSDTWHRFPLDLNPPSSFDSTLYLWADFAAIGYDSRRGVANLFFP